MDVRIGNLVRLLQAGPFDAGTLRQAQVALSGLRGHRDLAEMRGDLLVLLDDFAEAAQQRSTSAAAYLLAADVCEAAALREQFVERLVLAVHADPADARIAKRLRAALSGSEDRPRLLSLLALRAAALLEAGDTDPTVAAEAQVLHGAELARAGEIDAAVEAHERALDLDASMSTVEALAGLYARRRAPGDLPQAADLYCLLAELGEEAKEAAMLERALSLVPDHAEALARRAALRGEPVAPVQAAAAVAPVQTVAPARPVATTAMGSAPQPVGAAPPTAVATLGAVATAATAATGAAAPPDDHDDQLPAALQDTPDASHAAAQDVAPLGARSVTPPPVDPGAPTLNASMPGAELQATHVIATPRPPNAGEDGDSLRPQADIPMRRLSPVPARLWAPAAAVAAAMIGLVYVSLSGSEDRQTEARASESGDVRQAAASNSTTVAAPSTKAARAAKSNATPARPKAAARAKAQARRAKARTHGVVTLHRKRARVRGAKVPLAKALAAAKRSLPKVERCYRSALRRRPELEGRLVYELQVRSNGRARTVEKVGGTIRDKRLQTCAAKALRGTRFPTFDARKASKASKIAKLRLPLTFRARG